MCGFVLGKDTGNILYEGLRKSEIGNGQWAIGKYARAEYYLSQLEIEGF